MMEPLSNFAFKSNVRRYTWVWQAVLRDVQYQNPSQFPSPDPRVFEFKAYDGAAW